MHEVSFGLLRPDPLVGCLNCSRAVRSARSLPRLSALAWSTMSLWYVRRAFDTAFVTSALLLFISYVCVWFGLAFFDCPSTTNFLDADASLNAALLSVVYYFVNGFWPVVAMPTFIVAAAGRFIEQQKTQQRERDGKPPPARIQCVPVGSKIANPTATYQNR